MSNIKNEAKIKNPLIVAIREQLEHRALWMYLLCDEAKKKGLPPEEYAPAAIRRCGLYQGANLRAKAGGGDSLKGLKKTLFTKPAQWVFEMDVKRCTDDNLDIDFHYCPLVKAWQKQGCSDEEIQLLCDHAMCGDRGIAESFGCHLELPCTIAYGADICKIRFVRDKKED
ncbi:MAG: elastase-1 [Ruminococcaceae bacterium]|nr:elastase-1 [Oscillospiraceae bacterium]